LNTPIGARRKPRWRLTRVAPTASPAHTAPDNAPLAEPYVARAVTAANLELSEARNRNRADMSRTNHARQRPWLVPEKGFTEGTALGIGQLMADKTASG